VRSKLSTPGGGRKKTLQQAKCLIVGITQLNDRGRGFKGGGGGCGVVVCFFENMPGVSRGSGKGKKKCRHCCWVKERPLRSWRAGGWLARDVG